MAARPHEKRWMELLGMTMLASLFFGCSGDSTFCAPGSQEPCYTGAPGTEGVGACVAGVATCAADGSTFGACVGEVVPVTEVCSNGADDDCDGAVDEADEDVDGDGFSECEGDCCETVDQCPEPTLVNPGAIEAPTEIDSVAIDDNCNGTVDEAQGTCDSGLALADTDPLNGAKAIDLCRPSEDASDWGLVGADYVRANGSPSTSTLQNGLMAAFGSNAPQAGTSMLALSTGHARSSSDPDACVNISCAGLGSGTAPAGFPQDVPACAGSSDINDDVALSVTVRAPSNATGFVFDFTFFTFEYPEWVCTLHNDQFIALVEPAPPGSINGNIAFDAQANPVSVNIGLFEVCSGCAQGTGALLGTGFDVWDGGVSDAGATGWLRTTAPVTPGSELTIRFAIWDAGDTAWDSTVLIDNFQWLTDDDVTVSTKPVP